MTRRGSKTITCPDCDTPHLPHVAYPAGGIWRMRCRFCGDVQWRAKVELTEIARLNADQIAAVVAAHHSRSR